MNVLWLLLGVAILAFLAGFYLRGIINPTVVFFTPDDDWQDFIESDDDDENSEND